MSDTIAGLQRQIKNAGNLQSVVRTMKALAASNIVRYEQSVRALSAYYRTVELGLSVCFRQNASFGFIAEGEKCRKQVTVSAVVFGSDQGLVGQFNDVVADYAIKTLAALSKKSRVWAVGERVHACLADAGLPVMKLFSVPNSVQAITPLIGRILIEHEMHCNQSEITELHLIYNSSAPEASYTPVSQRLLPLDAIWQHQMTDLPWPTKKLPEIVGEDTVTLQTLIREYLFVSIFRACAESLAGENASRLAAMERAERNIDQLLEDLHSTYHRLRQNSIDEELFDLISGFEALAKSQR